MEEVSLWWLGGGWAVAGGVSRCHGDTRCISFDGIVASMEYGIFDCEKERRFLCSTHFTMNSRVEVYRTMSPRKYVLMDHTICG